MPKVEKDEKQQSLSELFRQVEPDDLMGIWFNSRIYWTLANDCPIK